MGTLDFIRRFAPRRGERFKGNAVFLTTYPFVKPRHGGQVRCAHIVKMLERCGFSVTRISVADENSFKKKKHLGTNDFPFPSNSAYRLIDGRAAPAYLSDYLSGLYAGRDEGAYRQILSAVPTKLDIIFLEQPWMLPAALRLRADRNAGLLIYDAQNDETALKEGIAAAAGDQVPAALMETIRATERAACAEADAMFVVSEADRAALSRYRDKEIFLAPNGVEPWAASAGHLARWRRVFGADVARFGLYVASGHPPNFLHFFQVFGDPLGFLAPDEAICIAGGASSQIESMLRGHRHEALVRSRLRFLGQLNNRDLSAIKELAHVFVLPIIEGSGSNLKTAEALYSRAWVVGTPVSFRGFEKFMGLPNVIVASPGKEFCDAVRYAMDRDCPVLSEKAVQSLSEITWENTLAGIPAALGHLKW